MDDERLSQLRAQVMEKFINLEWIINAIISQHYFKKTLLPFITEVLYDEYCSFALKRRIVEKIIPDIDKEQVQFLYRINTIRNYFAHCGQQLFSGSFPPSDEQDGWVPDPRKPSKPIDFERLYNEFVEIESSLCGYLFDIYQKLGGIAVKGKCIK